MAIKSKFLSAATKRWAFPVAAVLLPGGFVLLAFAWCYKLVLPKRRPAVDVKTGEPVAVAVNGNFITMMRAYSERARHELNCARRRQHALRETPARSAVATTAAEPRQETTIP